MCAKKVHQTMMLGRACEPKRRKDLANINIVREKF